MKSQLSGTSVIGYARGAGETPAGQAVHAASGAKLEPVYTAATPEETNLAVELAEAAFPIYSALSGRERGAFLRAIAAEIEGVADDLAERGVLETGLPDGRLRGETARTTGQLRLFAALIEEGSWVDARIERAQPDRAPLPKPDIRSMLRPLGPVAVFCASNFPLAFSVAGGDTAAALAAGCPVVVIAHHAHPGTAEIVGQAVLRAALATGMPEGVFSLLYGGGRSVGVPVVQHPAIQAVSFTGSRAGGTALMEVAANRPQPIPVYAEMSSVNPVVLLPGALDRGEAALAEAFFNSLTLGVGQFCTNPGLVFLPEGKGLVFLDRLKQLVGTSMPGTMLTEGIGKTYVESVEAFAGTAGVETLSRCAAPEVGKGPGAPAVFTVSVRRFLEEDLLQGEMFGPAALIVQGSLAEIEATIPELEGQLTATIHGTDEELGHHAPLVAALARKAGRVIFNGFPTGVEVCHSMVHGGPFPSTSDGRSTSVGSMSIQRFVRAVAYQAFPQAALAPELQDENPLGIWRMVNGERVR
ncbi:aldehyde dehydrogenase (NADP(+)) [Luteolibacter sp. GHJ8]|uniref:Aldehyde dehydrogenase (NADP(+)) n=1 Tax=Luteolibacter rhizosphaerae TaxID=2989719 RepID=A0ABT3FYK2_9BACT|nr:aldehyde dehydrogenase (NADP(+)) [Luteolibacter rhizosphaerae]MCW1912314.1 aldehyde dehydrogenase (NADP(+)) [Luteolibacter rhizosphaerae]